jgi:hypothetical protein
MSPLAALCGNTNTHSKFAGVYRSIDGAKDAGFIFRLPVTDLLTVVARSG